MWRRRNSSWTGETTTIFPEVWNFSNKIFRRESLLGVALEDETKKENQIKPKSKKVKSPR